MSPDSAVQVEAILQATLAELEDSGADAFNPVRFRFIKAVAGRSLAQGEAVRELLARRALAALEAYRDELSQPRAAQAGSDAHRSTTADLLAALVQRLDQGETTPAEQSGTGLAELLREQEAEALRSVDTAAAGAPPAPASTGLKAAHYFRDARQRQLADKLVTRAVTEAPEESGPLNPQKLAIASMATMRDLSPAYLGRFVAYIDTLFWLEKAGENHKT